ncbi:urease accessory protein [Ginsengibacter hankyongi]|uniref:Urease accessory protein n=1 Tax=Ginsengibacter hankyongi TaxID=2607284 RepID=A0A5J5IJN6_9BACT|nr:sulfite exporter TauE/SafE family protein [Ginsengibacter hankyongi]KAA9038585.1 urease accessory protein [Ginsengibacter hankyongi]
MFTFPLLLTIYAGFIHAFEADHLLAVSNIVSQRDNIRLSLKDGIFWGLGHTSTIFLIGVLMIVFKAGISDQYFRYFELLVGAMLIALAIYRMFIFFKTKKVVIHAHPHHHAGEQHNHLHVHVGDKAVHQHKHSLAYGVGLMHGLAGSGALILIAMSQMKSPIDGLIYLVVFGVGCIVGMLVAAGLFSIPFSKKIIQAQTLQSILIIATSLLCFLYGGKVIYDNLVA